MVIQPPCQPGDVLWVRETWAEMLYGFVYRADCEEPEGWDPDDKWRPSIHMRKVAARVFLLVKSVRAERLKDITASKAEMEGVGNLFIDECAYDDKYEGIPWNPNEGLAVHQFARLWDSTIKAADRPLYGWEANPWVWVIEFERYEKPEGWPG